MEKAKFHKIAISDNEYKNFTNLYLKNIDSLKEYIFRSNNPKYLYWNEIKYRNWIPKGYSKIDFWKILRACRKLKSIKLDFLLDPNGNIFSFSELGRFKVFCHEFDLNADKHPLKKDMTEKFDFELMKNFIIDEAIASSQLEGANTTINVAKEMIYSNHKPKTHSETMIYNNYKAMERLLSEFRYKELSTGLILKLHGILTNNDKDIPKDRRGAFRSDSDEIVVGSRRKINEYVYKTPNISFVKKQLKNLVLFANDKTQEKDFIHPLIKAIILHFWIGYLHPFVDGNGRLARCLFYWYMLKNNYDIISLYPISIKLKKSPKQYSDAYLYTENDENDLTYFIDYNLKKIAEAQSDFEFYLKRKEKDVENLLRFTKNLDLKSRQIGILLYIINISSTNFVTALKYEKEFNISKPIAIKDLKFLADRGILIKRQKGREIRYYLNFKKLKNKNR